MNIKIVVCFLFINLTSCGLSSPLESPPFEEIKEKQGSQLLITESEWAGTGKILFKNSIGSAREGLHLNIKGQFLKEQSDLTLHLYFDNFKYDTGIRLRFSLVKDPLEDHQDIAVDFAEPGFSFQSLAVLENSIDDEGNFHLRIELVNKVSESRRILIWNESVLVTSRQRRNKDKIITGNADFDSQNSQQVFFHWGKGFNWGLSMLQMKLFSVTREVPFVLD